MMKSRRIVKLFVAALCVSLVNIALLLDALFFSDKLKSPRAIFERALDLKTTKSKLFDPGLLSLLPHLASVDQSSLEPLLLTKRNETRRKIAFCIPVVERTRAYISQTLHSLFSNLEEQFKQDVVFIVVFAYINTSTKSFGDQTEQLMQLYAIEIEKGLLEVIAIPPKWYDPDMADIHSTFKDSSQRMLWRTKQNQDYIYMMNYGSKRAEYYMQLEDDIISTARYGRIIFDYIELKKDRPWFSMSFSSLGFYGRLVKSEDVKYITHAIALYYRYKPVDWIFYDVEYSRYCSPEQNSTSCVKTLGECRMMIGPPLFQHVGKVSSLPGKAQKLKESYFEKHSFKSNRGNPPAHVTSSMKHYLRHTAQAGYNNHGFMWFSEVDANDYVRIEFDKPVKIVGILIISGVAPAPLDQFGPETEVYVEYRNLEERKLGSFSKTGDFVAHLNGREVQTLELRVTASKERWVIVGHFFVDVLRE